MRKRPEEAGIPSLLLLNMMRRWEEQLCHVDGYVILRDGELVAEAYRHPYTKESRRYLHSVSKTVTAIGIGIAVGEGLLSVEDRVLSFFPDYRPSPQYENDLRELTVEHLLTMSAGQEGDGIDSIFSREKPAWQAFLDRPVTDRPGTRFVYNSGATYLLSKILTVVTGRTMLEYLTPRLFEPLGITDADWDEIDGASTGGWGCFLSLPDMAKIGELLRRKGSWQGVRLIPERWVERMTGWKIASEENQVYPDWRAGYCYQMWRCTREGCFRADGAFGQYILILPPKNMVVAIWSEDAFSQDMLNIFWEEVYDKVEDRVYGVDGNAYEQYRQACRKWSAPIIQDPTYSWLEDEISEREYRTSGQDGNVADSLEFSFSEPGRLRLTVKKAGAVSEIWAGNTGFQFGEGQMCFEIASFIRFGKKREDVVKYAASYRWLSDHSLRLHIDWLDTAHSTEITCVFGAGSAAAVFSPSYGKFQIGGADTPALLTRDQWFFGSSKPH